MSRISLEKLAQRVSRWVLKDLGSSYFPECKRTNEEMLSNMYLTDFSTQRAYASQIFLQESHLHKESLVGTSAGQCPFKYAAAFKGATFFFWGGGVSQPMAEHSTVREACPFLYLPDPFIEILCQCSPQAGQNFSELHCSLCPSYLNPFLFCFSVRRALPSKVSPSNPVLFPLLPLQFFSQSGSIFGACFLEDLN